jgi:hypothetical protein
MENTVRDAPIDARRPTRVWPTLFLTAASGVLFAAVCLRVEDPFEARWGRLRVGDSAEAASALLGEPSRRLDRWEVRVPDGDVSWDDAPEGQWWVYDVPGGEGADQHLLWMEKSRVVAKRLGRTEGAR